MNYDLAGLALAAQRYPFALLSVCFTVWNTACLGAGTGAVQHESAH